MTLQISSFSQIVMSVILLYDEIGLASLAGVSIIFVLFPLQFILGRVQRKIDQVKMKVKDERIRVTNEALSGIKVIKLYGWEPPFEEKIEEIRKRELG